jgi:hypothetical protein
VQEELQAEIKELLAESEQQPVATKLEGHQFNAFHVSADDFKNCKNCQQEQSSTQHHQSVSHQ